MRKAALVVQNVVTYTAIIAAANPDLRLFPGMTANVRIVVDTRENVLKIPNSALRYRPAGVAPVSTAAADAGGAPAAEDDGKAARVEGKGEARSEAKGKGRGDAMRERLVKELNLTAEQQARLEAIMKETRDKMRGLDGEGEERRKQAGRLRAEQRARIAEMLNPEQRKRYEEMAPSRAGGARQVTASRVWVPDAQGKPRAVAVRLGMTDGTYTELVSGEVQEGSQVIVGATEAGKAKSASKGGPRFSF
jgi:HlyD family secretion protein